MPAPDCLVRRARTEDAAPISALLSASTRRWIAPDCDADGARTLLDSMSVEATAQRLAGGYRYFLAFAADGSTLLGVAAIREPQHLYHLFVADEAQGRGLSLALWEAVRADVYAALGAVEITVNASRRAVPVYRHLGFVADGPERAENGIPFTPMCWRS
ncbi:GNAT family N-acetyltransferase [Lysobacter silvisoli]|uniref:GNAT family N-acetyltransferase n=1 Tax=Lysobacter silvisoli TaxID=2293254 RepID=A0A371K4H8_9GAMM|nr:GNAT family N-acetyltransferase [Lysobacter silvisoli]RDZ28833.1 GNAT family N-acetyltransferase [Lysobacter silvisoli]